MRRDRIEELLRLLEQESVKETYDGWTFGRRNVCGTSACALGHASFHPPFQAQGLTHQWLKRSNDEEDILVVYFDNWTNTAAAENFFEVDYGVVDYIFNRASNSREDVIYQLRYLLENGEDEFLNEFDADYDDYDD